MLTVAIIGVTVIVAMLNQFKLSRLVPQPAKTPIALPLLPNPVYKIYRTNTGDCQSTVSGVLNLSFI